MRARREALLLLGLVCQVLVIGSSAASLGERARFYVSYLCRGCPSSGRVKLVALQYSCRWITAL
jgi:hypothetical protein